MSRRCSLLIFCIVAAAEETQESESPGIEGPEAEVSLYFDAKHVASCDLEQADAYWETHPFRKTAEKMRRQLTAMQALKELKRVMKDLPFVLVGDLLLGWRRGCMARVGKTQLQVATFGPWLREVGTDAVAEAFKHAGHHLDTSGCPAPLTAGCRMQGHLKSATASAYVDIEVFLSAPPSFVSRRPGFFPRCSESCGESCSRCFLALPLEAPSGRFFACPLPINGFRLATWMNETYWVPLDVDAYLEVDYGDKWPETDQPTQSCQPSKSSGLSFSSYQSFIATLPTRREVLRMQSSMEKEKAAQIRSRASGESHFWKKFFGTRSLSWSVQPKPVPVPMRAPPHEAPLLPVALGVALGAWLVSSGMEGVLLSVHVFLTCAGIFLQRNMAMNQQPMSNALAAALVHALVALGVLLATPRRPSLRMFKTTCQTYFGPCPLWLWMLLPGALQALSFYLSFVSLASLDPLSFALLWSCQVYLLSLSARPRPWRSLCLAAAAASGLAAPVEAAAAALAAAAAQALAQAARAARQDVAHAYQYSLGFAVLLILATLQNGHAFAPNYWSTLATSKSAPAALACICILNFSKPFFESEVPAKKMALTAGLSVVSIAALQAYNQVPLPTRSWHGILQVSLGLVAATAHAMDIFTQVAARRPPPPPTPKKIARPPAPAWPKKWSGNLSEVGSTAATEGDLDLPDGI